MVKDKEDILGRYIKELTRYMTFENSIYAEKDLRNMIKEKLGEDYSKEDLINFLEKLGSPFGISNKYQSRANILISGRHYEIYLEFLKILFISLLISMPISLTSGFYNKGDIFTVLESIKDLLILILASTTISLFIAERVKGTRIFKSLLKQFKIVDLYRNKKAVNLRNYKKFLLIVLVTIIFTSIEKYNSLAFYNIKRGLQIIFFLVILNDSNRVSEGFYGKYISILSIFCNSLILLILAKIFRTLDPIYLNKWLYILFIFSLLDTIKVAFKSETFLK